MYINANYTSIIDALHFYHYLYREKGRKKSYYDTDTLATIFLTFQFNVDEPGMMTESRGKNLDTSFQSDNN